MSNLEPAKNNRIFLKCSGGPIPARNALEEYFKAKGEIIDIFLPARNNSVAYIEFSDPVTLHFHFKLKFSILLISCIKFAKLNM